MRIFVSIICILLFVFCHFPNAYTQDKDDKAIKIGFVDLKRVYEESGRKEFYDKKMEDLRREKNITMNEMREKVVAMEKIKWELSDEKRKEKDEEIKKLKDDLETFVRDANNDLNRKMSEYEREFARELKELVTKLGDEEGFTYIISDVVLLYSQSKYDLTEKVIAIFKQKTKPAEDKNLKNK